MLEDLIGQLLRFLRFLRPRTPMRRGQESQQRFPNWQCSRSRSRHLSSSGISHGGRSWTLTQSSIGEPSMKGAGSASKLGVTPCKWIRRDFATISYRRHCQESRPTRLASYSRYAQRVYPRVDMLPPGSRLRPSTEVLAIALATQLINTAP